MNAFLLALALAAAPAAPVPTGWLASGSGTAKGSDDADLASHDLVVVGGPEDNAVAARMAAKWKLPLETGKGFFRADRLDVKVAAEGS